MEVGSDKNACRPLCRLCLNEDVINFNIFDPINNEKQIGKKIITCFPLQVSETDNLPKMICPVCYVTLNAAYKLREKAIRSDKALRYHCRIPNKPQKRNAPLGSLTEEMTEPKPTIAKVPKLNELGVPTTYSKVNTMTFQSAENNKLINQTCKKNNATNDILSTDPNMRAHSDALIVKTPQIVKQNPPQMQAVPESPSAKSIVANRKKLGKQLEGNSSVPPATPQLNVIKQDIGQMQKPAPVDNILHKNKSGAGLDKKSANPLVEKCVLLDISGPNIQHMPTALPKGKKTRTMNSVTTAVKRNIFDPNPREMERSLGHILDKNEPKIEKSNLLEGNMENPIKNKKESTSKFINQCQTKPRNKNPANCSIFDILEKKLPIIRNTTPGKDAPKTTKKVDEGAFTEKPETETASKFTPAVGPGRKQSIFNPPEAQIQDPILTVKTVKNSGVDLGNDKKTEQMKRLARKIKQEPNPSTNDASDHFFETQFITLLSSQSDEPEIVWEATKEKDTETLVAEWKKGPSPWDSQQYSYGSDDSYSGVYRELMATGDVFGIGLNRKIARRKAMKEKERELELKVSSAKGKEEAKGKHQGNLLSPLLTASSDEDFSKYLPSTSGKFGPLPATLGQCKRKFGSANKANTPWKTTVCPTKIEQGKAIEKSPVKPSYKARAASLPVPDFNCASESSASDYRLTPCSVTGVEEKRGKQ